MAVRVTPGYVDQLVAHTLTELAARKHQEEVGRPLFQSDICDWAEHHFYVPLTSKPIILPLHQKAILRYFFTRNEDHHLPFQNLVYSTIKKSGKSTGAGVVARYYAETQARYGEIYNIGNDLDQAKDRSFKEILRSLELTPGYNQDKEVLPGRWNVHRLSMRCLLTGSVIRAVAVDAKGEAGGQPALTVWTELWGFENTDAKRFWDEMTPIPTIPDSIRLVETYAGYDGESELLAGLYNLGMEGHQLTAGELAAKVCREDIPGESFRDFVDCWHETEGDPNVKIPLWINPPTGLGMYWDSGMVARRMPWQHEFESQTELCRICHRPQKEHDIGIPASEYYAAQEAIGPPAAYRRLHLNEWVGAESQFVNMEQWDACGHVHDIPVLAAGDKTPLVGSADAAVTGDCFGIVVVNRCPNDPNCVDVRAIKKWDPKESGGIINLEEPEAFIRAVAQVHNLVQLAYDPFQLESIAQRLRKDGVVWVQPFIQAGDRLKADSQLYDFIMSKRIHYFHQGDCPGGVRCDCIFAPLREHIANANAKLQTNEDSKLRIVKKASGRKIDLAVALSMAAYRCMYLRLA